MIEDTRPKLTHAQAFGFLADIMTNVDKIPRATIVGGTKISKAAFRMFNIVLRERCRPEPKLPPSLLWWRNLDVRHLLQQLELEDESK